jgi:hypothetical protein
MIPLRDGATRVSLMNIRPLLLSMTNAALYLVTCTLVGTGLLLELRMDEEDGAARLFGMDQNDWGEIHFVVAITFAVLAVLHLVQNWGRGSGRPSGGTSRRGCW